MDIGIIIGFLIAGVMLSIIYGVWRHRDEKKYEDMKEHYEKRVKELYDQKEHYHDKYIHEVCAKSAKEGKVKTLETVLSKFLGENNNSTDSIFIFEGRCYRPTDFQLNREEHRLDTLSVDFIHVPIDVTKE